MTGGRGQGEQLARGPLLVAGALVAVLAVLVALVARSCSGGDTADRALPATAPPATEASTSTTAPAPLPVWPLLGTLGDPARWLTPAVAVKVDNSPQARPHAGLDQADLVYELQVESITRFIEVYHSQVPDRVGPVRSARSSDIDLLFGLGRPLLVWSGGNPGVTAQVRAADGALGLMDLSVNSAAGGHYYRDRSRSAPHNLYANARAIKDGFGMEPSGAPSPIFAYALPDHVPPEGSEAAGVRIDFGQVVVEYTWDPARRGWARFQAGGGDRAFVDEAGVQVAPENVVVLFLEYSPDPVDARSPKAQSVGAGDGFAFTNGRVSPVRWRRDTNRDGWNLTHSVTGETVQLAAGRAWVALVPAGQGRADIL